MKVDGSLGNIKAGASGVGAKAAGLEEAGYDGIWSADTAHDPFIPLTLAAEHTSHVELGTSIAVAFARNPMSMAMVANDLHLLSGGRHIIGLGSQVKSHITKRFSMEWSHPAPRMREFILAMRAIWDSWNHDTKLDFQGDFYTHTLMSPFFNPGPNPHGVPKVFLAGVGEHMTEVAGETCDGFICHPFTTEQYLREVSMPALQRGLDKVGRSLDDFEISAPAFMVTGSTEEEIDRAKQGARRQIAFYASTAAYKGVLDLHGWGDIHGEVNALAKDGRWAEMADAIDDEVLNAFAVVAEPTKLAECYLERYGDVMDRLNFYVPYESDAMTWLPVLAALKSANA